MHSNSLNDQYVRVTSCCHAEDQHTSTIPIAVLTGVFTGVYPETGITELRTRVTAFVQLRT